MTGALYWWAVTCGFLLGFTVGSWITWRIWSRRYDKFIKQATGED